MSVPGPENEETNLLNPEVDLRNTQTASDVLQAEGSNEISYLTLSNLLEQKQEMSFIQNFQKYYLHLSEMKMLDNKKQEKYVSLLITAIEKGLNKAVEAILKTKVDVNIEENGITAIASACARGNSDALKMLLIQNNENLKDNNLLISTIMNLHETTETHDYMGCFEVLLNSSKINVNEVNGLNTSALYFAAQYKNEQAIKKLLEKGAYIGTKDDFNRIPISRINSKFLEECFDECIKTNGANHGDTNFEIIIDYTNLLPTNFAQSEEMFPLKYIADSEELKYLLNHPLITSFLFLKWHKLSCFFYANFIISFLFCISLISYILLDFNNAEVEAVQTILMILSILGLIYVIVRETFQWLTLRRELFITSFAALTNFVEMALIVLTILTLSQSNYKQEPQRTFAVLTILLVSIEIYLIVGSLPILTISTHMLMLKEVCTSFMKSSSQYFIFFVTFGLCFHMVLRKTEHSDQRMDDGYFNSTVGSIFKVFLMAAGEFDSGNITFSSSISYGIFLLFVVFMAIVLLNLLNGLAVSDTQIIRAQAELNGSICRTHLLANLEKCLTSRNRRIAVFMKIWPFNLIYNKLTTSFRDYIKGNYIFIRPNDNNNIFISKQPLRKVSINTPALVYPFEDDERWYTNLASPMRNCCGCKFFNFKCSSMDIKIVKTALSILEKKQEVQKQKQIILEQENRLKNIEKKMDELIMYTKKPQRSRKAITKYRKENQIKRIEKNGKTILSLLKRLVHDEKP